MARIVTYKGKYYDTGTANKSFLQFATDLKAAGVKNWYFALEIKNPALINVNPYAEDEHGHTTLPQQIIDMITLEIVNNPWYYLREIARIVAAGAPRGIPYQANKGIMAQAWSFLHGIDSWLCITRQKGKTKSALSIQNWGYSFGTMNSTMIFVNKDLENSKTNLDDFKTMISFLPEYLRYESIINEDGKIDKGKDGATYAEHPVTHNKIKLKGKATSMTNALSLARGLSAPIIHFDECEFCPYIDYIVYNSVSTYEQSAKISRDNGTLYGRIFTSTPGNTDTAEGKAAEKLLSKTVKWREEFYDMDPEDVKAILFGGKGNYDDDHIGVVYIEYSYREIGLTNQWFRETAAKIGDKLTVRREILLQRIRGSSLSPYDMDDLDLIITYARKPIRSITIGEFFTLDIYEELVRDRVYIVGVDCSTGTGKDSNAITILDPYTERPVAEFSSPYIGEPALCRVLTELVTKHIPKAVLCIERNHVGDAIIAFLMESPIAGRLYFDRYKEILEENMKSMETHEDFLKAAANRKTYYGVYTEGKSRKAMFGILADRVKGNQKDFVTQNITQDIARLVTKGDKIEAAAGWHDDSVMSYNICMYVLRYGNNLSTFGIEKGTLISDTLTPGGGLLPPGEVMDLDSLPEDVRDVMRVESMRQRKTAVAYEDSLRNAFLKSQRESKQLSHAGIIENSAYKNTPQNGMYDLFDDAGDEVLDFLASLR